MSLADNIFIDMCKDVIENGTSTEGEKVRPVWEDGTSAYTIKRFGVVNFTATSGTAGQTRTVPLEKPTAISWA